MSMRWTLKTLTAALALVALPWSASAQGTPQYGGQLTIGTPYITLTALSWDPADFNWKHNVDTGLVYEQLFAADLGKSRRNGGKFPFYADAWLHPEALRGELAEKWEWKQNPLRVEIQPMGRGYEHVLDGKLVENAPMWASDAVEKLSATPVEVRDWCAAETSIGSLGPR